MHPYSTHGFGAFEQNNEFYEKVCIAYMTIMHHKERKLYNSC